MARHPEMLGRLARRFGPDTKSFFHDPGSVGLFLEDVKDREVGELHRCVVPEHADRLFGGSYPRRLGLADRSDAPGPVTATPPTLRGGGEMLATDVDVPRPSAGLRQPPGRQAHPVL